MKWIIPILLLSSPVLADEMRVIGKFKVPNSAFGKIYWIEMQSDTDGKLQCAVRVDSKSGGLSCDWPSKKPAEDIKSSSGAESEPVKP